MPLSEALMILVKNVLIKLKLLKMCVLVFWEVHVNKRFKSEPGPGSQTQKHSQETLGKTIRGPFLEDCGSLVDDMNQWKLPL